MSSLSPPALADPPLESLAAPARPAGSGARHRTLMHLAAALVGAALIAFALVSGSLVAAAVGAVLLWYGVQRLGERVAGSSFRLGLWAARGWLLAVGLAALLADWLPVDDWRTADLTVDGLAQRPAMRWPEPLGRTADGYSELSHIIYGARSSLTIALVAAAGGFAVGVLAGLVAGWYGGLTDSSIGVFTNASLAVPPLILLLTIIAIYGSSTWTLAAGLAVACVPAFVLLMRAHTMSFRGREFVLAARATGAKDLRLMTREVLPNAVVPVLLYTPIVVAALIVAEGSISYLGFGIPAPKPSWGGMVAVGQPKLKTHPHLVFVPATALFLTVLSFSRIGEDFRVRTHVGGVR